MGCTTPPPVAPAFADMSETERVEAALLSIASAFAAAIAQRPAYEAMAIDMVRMVEAREYEQLAALGDDMVERIVLMRVSEAH